MAEPLGVLVPDELGEAMVRAADGLTPVRYALGEPLPPPAATAGVLVPGRGPVDHHLDLMAGLPDLRLVQLLYVGVELWSGRLPGHILLSNARGAQAASTAEWALAALLAVLREFPAAAAAQASGVWGRVPAGETLSGKRVLVVGAGAIGRELRVRLAACGAIATLVGRTARPGVHGTGELPGLLPAHDAVVLAVPLDERTRGMADARFLDLLPPGAIVVNAARGAVVDTDALVDRLRRGRLRAALDVTDPEPLPPGHPLWSVPGVLITPHIAGGAGDHERRAWSVAVDQITQFARGGRPGNVVHPAG
ncbi:NAD(P)-dependent oxidoreductase [Streptomyces sp. SL13]|uniref:NAD(P)-dependent oxidoreductase n=1 Tax=Streptantibioticus silvisoli TaxID=2705255 RepID=A0AA90KBH1_9ACTN|nr:NAD(P)-dependent oxidoreductase [Streptantibioticus silvisoli]MDI5973317.1 NAD(P)-dependent oxidoreductase [Streptantibioticus silvisoli]